MTDPLSKQATATEIARRRDDDEPRFDGALRRERVLRPLRDHTAFVLRRTRDHVCHQLTGGRRGVDIDIETHELPTLPRGAVQQAGEVVHRTGDAVELGRDQHLGTARLQPGERSPHRGAGGTAAFGDLPLGGQPVAGPELLLAHLALDERDDLGVGAAHRCRRLSEGHGSTNRQLACGTVSVATGGIRCPAAFSVAER